MSPIENIAALSKDILLQSLPFRSATSYVYKILWYSIVDFKKKQEHLYSTMYDATPYVCLLFLKAMILHEVTNIFSQ